MTFILIEEIIDEAYCVTNEYVNEQNCQIWDDTSQHEHPMHSEKVTILCESGLAVSSVAISLRTIFAKSSLSKAITTNRLFQFFFWPELYDLNINDMCFQQDTTSCHTVHANLDLSNE